MRTCRNIVRELKERQALHELTDPSVFLESLRQESFRRDQRSKNLRGAVVLTLVFLSFVAALLS